MNTATRTEFPALTDVVSVYSGKAGKCCCGCSGKHRASAHRQVAAKSRGYAVDDDEVSDRSVKLIYRKVKAAFDGRNRVIASMGRIAGRSTSGTAPCACTPAKRNTLYSGKETS